MTSSSWVPSGAVRTTLMLAILKPTVSGDAFGDQLESVTEHPVRACGKRADRAPLSSWLTWLPRVVNLPHGASYYAVPTVSGDPRHVSRTRIALPRL